MVAGEAGAVPPPRVDDSLTLGGRTLWEGLLDKRVTLVMKDEQTLEGTVVAQSSSDLAVARASDGLVVSVPKDSVAGVRTTGAPTGATGAAMPVGLRPRDDGRGAHATGAVLLAIGAPATLAGIVMLGICPGCFYIHLPLILPGAVMITGGALSLKKAKKQRRAFHEAWGIPVARLGGSGRVARRAPRWRLTPTFGAGPRGGSAGFVLRF
jgi:hypothetical protein